MLPDLLLIALLILANGFFAAAEMAVVSARQARLQAQAETGNLRAKNALRLRENPAEFLATVQIGITLVGTLASAVGGVEAARWLAPQIARFSLLEPYASQVAIGLVVLTISYASLLFGELVPKRLAIRNPEQLAMAVARIFEFFARIVKLPIRLLMASADFVLRLFGTPDPEDQITSPEEIEVLVRRGAAEGVILPIQERMIERVFDYADRSTRDEMTPRTEIIALEVETPIHTALEIAKKHGFSRYPVIRGDIDHVLGYVHIKDLIWANPDDHLPQMLRQAVFIPEGVTLPQAFTTLTRAGRQLGIVLDEYGGTEGLITLENILEVIVGEIEDEHSPVAEVPQQSDDGEWRIAGSESIAEVEALLGIDFAANGVFNTLAGFIMSELGTIPKEGDFVSFSGYCFVVEEMERFRVISVRIYRVQTTPCE
jgi:putative hemolysin